MAYDIANAQLETEAGGQKMFTLPVQLLSI